MPLDLASYHGPPGCLPVLTGSPSVLIVGRSSVPAGRIAYRAAVQDLLQAASILEKSTGIPIVKSLPEQAELERMLRGAPATVSTTPEGDKFTNRYLQWSDPSSGVHVLVSAGSGRKVDDGLVQPALTRTAEVFRVLRPGLLFAKRLDRMGRRAWGFGPLMELLDQTGSWMGDEEGLRAPGDWNAMHVFMNASQGQKVAEGIPVMTRQGMTSRTGTTMVDGQVAYHVAQPPPPGTTRLGMLSRGGGLGEILLVLDSPDYLPDDATVATGMPRIYDASGRHVDQVANIRWALSTLGRPEWSRRAVATELARRQTSTYALRANQGSDATVQPPERRATVFPVITSILNNLAMYETGRLELRLGVEGFPDIVIEGVMPQDGPWATPQDFVRIRHMMREGQERRDRHRSMSLSSLPASLSGKHARLLTAAGRRPTSPSYVVALRTRPPGRQPREIREPVVPHQVLAESIVESLARAGDMPLALWRSPDPLDGELSARITRLEMAVEAIESSRRAIMRQVADVDETGQPRIFGSLLTDMNAEYARLTESALPQATQQLQDAKSELEESRLSLAAEGSAARAEDLLRLIAALRDPHDLSLADVWRQMIHDLAFEVHQEQDANHTTDVITWRGSIVFSDLSDRYVIEFQGVHRTGAGAKVQDRVQEIIDKMKDGVPFDDCDVERRPVLKAKVAEHLGLPPRRFLVGSCLDSRITRVATTLFLDSARPDHELAAQLLEDRVFIARIREIYLDETSGRSVWLQRKYTLVTRWHVAAAAQEGLVAAADLIGHAASSNSAVSTLTASIYANQWRQVKPGQYQLSPCPHCGGLRRAPMRIPEPIGLLCLDCRRDQGGLRWPTDPYDRWRCAPDLW